MIMKFIKERRKIRQQVKSYEKNLRSDVHRRKVRRNQIKKEWKKVSKYMEKCGYRFVRTDKGQCWYKDDEYIIVLTEFLDLPQEETKERFGEEGLKIQHSLGRIVCLAISGRLG